MAAKKRRAEARLVHLRYVGDGSYVLGAPTADHDVTRDEAERLVATGLYVVDGPVPDPVETPESVPDPGSEVDEIVEEGDHA